MFNNKSQKVQENTKFKYVVYKIAKKKQVKDTQRNKDINLCICNYNIQKIQIIIFQNITKMPKIPKNKKKLNSIQND